MRITRRKLTAIVDDILANSENQLTTLQAEKVRKTLETIEAVLLDSWWSEALGCGCIVGTPLKARPENKRLYTFSIEVDTALRDYKGLTTFEMLKGDDRVLKVTG